MPNSNTRRLLLISLTGALAVPGVAGADDKAKADAKVPCWGINACKGKSACGTKDSGCAGQNSCKMRGYLEIDKETCLKINGGRLTEAAAKETPKAPEKPAPPRKP